MTEVSVVVARSPPCRVAVHPVHAGGGRIAEVKCAMRGVLGVVRQVAAELLPPALAADPLDDALQFAELPFVRVHTR
jgi:hypothetical protein